MKQNLLVTFIVLDQLLYTTSAVHLFVDVTFSFYLCQFLTDVPCSIQGREKNAEQLLVFRFLCRIFPYLLSLPPFSSFLFFSSPGLQIDAVEISLALPTPLTHAATGCSPTAALSLLSKPPVTAAPQTWSQRTESLSSWSKQWRSVSCRSLAYSRSQFTASTFTPAIDRSNAAAPQSLSSPEPSLQVRGEVICLQMQYMLLQLTYLTGAVVSFQQSSWYVFLPKRLWQLVNVETKDVHERWAHKAVNPDLCVHHGNLFSLRFSRKG